MLLEDTLNFSGVDGVYSPSSCGTTLASSPVPSSNPSPPSTLVNRIPDGFHPILIDMEKYSRSDVRRLLHSVLCCRLEGAEAGSSEHQEKPLGRCGCELLEFDYQPDFLFRKRKEPDTESHYGDDGYSSGDSSEDTDMCSDANGYVPDDVNGRADHSPSQCAAESQKITIKRPPNSFIVYRSQRHNELVKQYRGGNKVISGIISKEWRNLSREEKKKYEDIAAAKKREHQLLYPNYKFAPRKRKM
ncbi:hypothetical protein GGF46_001860 [Coemansia sp. RSA 552]|nr:hypothetical protein GGF46_001860 [Coemansia sp. RSA 552]